MTKRLILVATASLLAASAGGWTPVFAQRAPTAAAANYANIAEAARAADWAKVSAMASTAGADLNVLSEDGSTALLFAINARQADLIKTLLDAGADIAKPNAIGVTPLQFAINKGDTATVNLLLDRGADAKALVESGESLLMSAVRYGDAAMVSALIAKGADKNYVEPKNEQDAVMIAVRADKTPALEALIKAGADLNHQTSPGPTPITRPPGAGNGSTGEGMSRSGVPTEGQRLSGIGQMTALLYAARDGRTEAARLLIQGGAKLELAEYNQITPLLMAITNDRHDIAKLLINAGANVNAADWYGRAPLWAAVESRNRDSGNAANNGVDRDAAFEVIKMVVEKGADVNARVQHFVPRPGGHSFNLSYVVTTGETPFFKAAYTNDLPLMQYLLEHGADWKIPTFSNTTPLMAAAGVGWVRNQTFTPGGEAAQLEAVKLLLDKGADINAANEQGYAAIHGAAYRWSPKVVEYLVDRGASLTQKDGFGRTALTWAQGVTTPSTPPVENPATIALISKLIAEGKGVGASPQQANSAPAASAARGGA